MQTQIRQKIIAMKNVMTRTYSQRESNVKIRNERKILDNNPCNKALLGTYLSPFDNLFPQIQVPNNTFKPPTWFMMKTHTILSDSPRTVTHPSFKFNNSTKVAYTTIKFLRTTISTYNKYFHNMRCYPFTDHMNGNW